jgi:catechol 2,3-dioxygenase-like lactoylglutathione lyase family enzyme
MIRGVHTMFYTSDPDGLRAFLRDKLRLPYTDVGEGWLIFDLPEADMGCHPVENEGGVQSGTPHLSFYCDDIHQTMTDLRERGVEFTDGVVDQGWGFVTRFRMPGSFEVQLYQPRYVKRSASKPQAKRKKKPLAPRGKKRSPRTKPKSKATRRRK